MIGRAGAGDQWIEHCEAGFGDRPAPSASPLVEAEGVAPSSPRCERGILLLNYAPEWGDRRGSNPHLHVHSVSCSATTPRPPGFVPGGRFERPLLESESSGLPVSRPGSRGGGNRTLVGRSSGGCSAIELRLCTRRGEGSRTPVRPLIEQLLSPLSYASSVGAAGTAPATSGSRNRRSSNRALHRVGAPTPRW